MHMMQSIDPIYEDILPELIIHDHHFPVTVVYKYRWIRNNIPDGLSFESYPHSVEVSDPDQALNWCALNLGELDQEYTYRHVGILLFKQLTHATELALHNF
jgi:hypothetical protein